MTTEQREKLRRLAGRLLEKSRADEARWKPDPLYDSSCVLDLNNARIRILRETSRTKANRIAFEVSYPLDEVATAELSAAPEEPDWTPLQDLYNEACRIANQSDRLLADVESALNQEGPIGLVGDSTPLLGRK